MKKKLMPKEHQRASFLSRNGCQVERQLEHDNNKGGNQRKEASAK